MWVWGNKVWKTIPCWYKKLCSHQEPYNSRQTLIKMINKRTCLCYWYLLMTKILCEICLYFVSEGEIFTSPPTLLITTHNFRMTPLYRSPNPPVQWRYLTQMWEATEAKSKWVWAIPYTLAVAKGVPGKYPTCGWWYSKFLLLNSVQT